MRCARRVGHRRVGKAGVEPQFDLGQRLQHRAHDIVLRFTPHQRIEVGRIQLPRVAMTAQRTGQLDRVAAGAQARHDRPIGAAVATLGAHDLALHEVDDGNEEHAGSKRWGIGIAAAGGGEYLSDGARMQPHGAAHG